MTNFTHSKLTFEINLEDICIDLIRSRFPQYHNRNLWIHAPRFKPDRNQINIPYCIFTDSGGMFEYITLNYSEPIFDNELHEHIHYLQVQDQFKRIKERP